MIIYYKAPRGKWINGATGESLSIPDTFEVDYIDLKVLIETPILTLNMGNQMDGGIHNDFIGINLYGTEEYLNSLDGFDVYEIVD